MINLKNIVYICNIAVRNHSFTELENIVIQTRYTRHEFIQYILTIP